MDAGYRCRPYRRNRKITAQSKKISRNVFFALSFLIRKPLLHLKRAFDSNLLKDVCEPAIGGREDTSLSFRPMGPRAEGWTEFHECLMAPSEGGVCDCEE